MFLSSSSLFLSMIAALQWCWYFPLLPAPSPFRFQLEHNYMSQLWSYRLNLPSLYSNAVVGVRQDMEFITSKSKANLTADMDFNIFTFYHALNHRTIFGFLRTRSHVLPTETGSTYMQAYNDEGAVKGTTCLGLWRPWLRPPVHNLLGILLPQIR